jgi:hypothetical protein
MQETVMGRTKLFLWAIALVAAGLAGWLILFGIRWRYQAAGPFVLRGAVIRQSTDVKEQSPIANVDVQAQDGAAMAEGKSDFSGLFQLNLQNRVAAGQQITLSFRHPDYHALDMKVSVGDILLVARMVPIHGEVEAELNLNEMPVSNVLVRYSTQAMTATEIGSSVKTFEVENTGDVPCKEQASCSPDGKWQAQIGTASLDAGNGNVFRNARVSCIAGPCPFTAVDSDHFADGERYISVAVRDWSDTTTFLLQAEVYHSADTDIVRSSYPVIFGRAMNFTVPSEAEGTSIEAEINGTLTVFPLGPDPTLSWADCSVRVERNQSKDYRCELKAGYGFH